MKLISAHVTNFRSVEDSEKFDVADVTCLVGKNEAGKTAVLTALHQLRPYNEPSRPYDKVLDYPRRFLSDYKQRHNGGEAPVCSTEWMMLPEDKAAVAEALGGTCLTGDIVKITKGYGDEVATWSAPVDQRAVIQNLADEYRLDDDERKPIAGARTTAVAAKALTELGERTDKQTNLLTRLGKFRNCDAHLAALDVLDGRTPKFKLSSHFDRMSGDVSVDKIISDKQAGTLSKGDAIFLEFLEYAGTALKDLQDASRYEELKAQCEAASNRLTDQIFEYWSQNSALEVAVDVAQGKSGDPPPFHSGTVVHARVKNNNHRVSVPFSERSAGFVWFFSFLVEFTQIRKSAGDVIILLDEPGLTLHGKAQKDLLRYVYEELKPNHQVIYTTHSPFLVPAEDLGAVRVVEDVITYDERHRPIVLGTKVRSDVLTVDKDTLFPLQGALGYDIAQSLFIGEHVLLVEGPSDVLFLKGASNALRALSRPGLDERWVLCPSGGIDKVQPFVSLFGGNKLDVAALTDCGDGDKKKIDTLRKSEILAAGKFFTTSDFLTQATSDVEDLIGRDNYVSLVNAAFGLEGKRAITEVVLGEVAPQTERIVKLIEGAFRLAAFAEIDFDHFRPAAWLIERPDYFVNMLRSDKDAADRLQAMFDKFNGLLG